MSDNAAHCRTTAARCSTGRVMILEGLEHCNEKRAGAGNYWPAALRARGSTGLPNQGLGRIGRRSANRRFMAHPGRATRDEQGPLSVRVWKDREKPRSTPECAASASGQSVLAAFGSA